MDVAFSSASLAALCKTERRLARRWGPQVGRMVARRLLDLVAADAATLDRLPDARVSINGSGEATITFADEIVVRGVISNSQDGIRAAQADADHMLITSLDVHRSDQR